MSSLDWSIIHNSILLWISNLQNILQSEKKSPYLEIPAVTKIQTLIV